jgi:chromosome segregation ATPase
MRYAILLAAALALAVSGLAQQPSKPNTATQQPEPAAANDEKPSIAEAARKAREQKKQAPKAKVVFTNDNLPSGGAVSVVGGAASAATGGQAAARQAGSAAQSQAGQPEENPDSEAAWRKRFAEAREKLRLAQQERDILQRELNLLLVQYSGDPQETLRQEFDRSKINEHTEKIRQKDAEIAQLQQQLAALEDELRRKGLPPGWAREP